MRPHKYHARPQREPCPFCGYKHASQKERMRCWELAQWEKAGTIRDLRRQVRYRLDVGPVHICDYVADFVYEEGGVSVTEDVKGYRTREYLYKAKLMRALHGITIRET